MNLVPVEDPEETAAQEAAVLEVEDEEAQVADQEAVVLEETLTTAHEKCTRQLVLNAEKNAKFPSNQLKTSQYFAKTVIKRRKAFIREQEVD